MSLLPVATTLASSVSAELGPLAASFDLALNVKVSPSIVTPFGVMVTLVSPHLSRMEVSLSTMIALVACIDSAPYTNVERSASRSG